QLRVQLHLGAGTLLRPFRDSPQQRHSRFREPTPEPIETSVRANIPAVPAPTQASPPPAIFIIVTKPTKIMIGRRDEIMPPGTKVQLVARAGDTVQVRYKGESTFVKISSTDLK